jgi:RNA 3'-terminal phosphate cyclase (ATP)
MLLIDGSIGEGGGQILRSAITISTIIGKPIKVTNIRSNRKDPGLKHQHVLTIQLLSRIFNIHTENVSLGSEWIRFDASKDSTFNEYDASKDSRFNEYDKPANDAIIADIGTAGSIPLLLQTLIPTIAISQKDMVIRLSGGTDVKFSPTIDYIKYVLRDAYSKIGIAFDINVLKRGFYPRGQGVVEITIRKATKLYPIEFCNFKEVEPNIISIAARLPRHIPERQIGSAIATLEKKGIRYLKHKSILENSESPGSSILVYATSESGIYLGADSIGEKGIKAEIIGNRAAKKFIDNYEFRACIDQHLADMLVLPLSFVDGKSRYKISRITKHLLTNLEVIKMLNSIEYHFEKISENEFILSIEGNSVI